MIMVTIMNSKRPLGALLIRLFLWRRGIYPAPSQNMMTSVRHLTLRTMQTAGSDPEARLMAFEGLFHDESMANA